LASPCGAHGQVHVSPHPGPLGPPICIRWRLAETGPWEPRTAEVHLTPVLCQALWAYLVCSFAVCQLRFTSWPPPQRCKVCILPLGLGPWRARVSQAHGNLLFERIVFVCGGLTWAQVTAQTLWTCMSIFRSTTSLLRAAALHHGAYLRRDQGVPARALGNGCVQMAPTPRMLLWFLTNL